MSMRYSLVRLNRESYHEPPKFHTMRMDKNRLRNQFEDNTPNNVLINNQGITTARKM